jgi:hypothetical protein
LPNYGIAGAYGAVMLASGLILAFFYVRLVHHGKKYTVITGRGYRPRQIALGNWKWAALAFAFLYLCMEVFIPFLVLLWASLLPHLQLPSAEAWGQISLNNFLTIFDFVDALPFINTAILMIAVPTATAGICTNGVRPTAQETAGPASTSSRITTPRASTSSGTARRCRRNGKPIPPRRPSRVPRSNRGVASRQTAMST